MPIRDSDLLAMWERTAGEPPARRAFVLLACASADADAVASLSVGERDRRLLMFRREVFGDAIEGVVECPACAERVELRIAIADITAAPPARTELEPVVADGYHILWRLPTCGDLAELADEPSAESLRRRLLQRCLLEIRRDRSEDADAVAVDECPPGLVKRVCDAMSQADPCGDIRLETSCPTCGTTWQASFDAGAYLWRELDAWARRLLRDVHALASVYGWSERDILAMPSSRRRSYLELVEA